MFSCCFFYQYADPVADLLDKWGTFRARLFRESCVFHRGNYVKVHYSRVLFKAHQAYRYDRVKSLVSFVPLTGFALHLEFHENSWIFEIFSRALENSLKIQFWHQLLENSLNLSINLSCRIKNEWESYETFLYRHFHK